MSFRDWFKLLAFFSLVFMTGCQNRSSLEADPQIDLPCDWKEQQSAEDITLDRWWETFDDCQLNELEELAISFNKTTAVATQRLRKLYYQARVNFGALFPEVNLSPGFFKQGSVAAGFPGAIIDQDLAEGPAENVDVLPVENNNGPPATGNIVGQNRNVFTNITVPLNFRWQLDLWGKLSNRYLAAFYQFQSSYFDLSQTLNQVTTDVAVNYFLLRGLVSEEVILRKIIAVRLEALQINQARYEAGLSFYLDVTRAEVDLNSAKSELEDVLRRQALQQNLLAVLTGHYAADFELQAASLPQLLQPPDIPVILPAKLLVRRPDIFARLALIKSEGGKC